MTDLKSLAALLLVVCACTACSNDEPTPEATAKTMTVDATAYDKWVYVDFKSGKEQTVTMNGSDDEKLVTIDWQIAIHRYSDVKTNGGSAIDTGVTTFDQPLSLPTTGYTADVEGKVLYKFIMPPTDENYITTHINSVMVWMQGSPMDNTLKPNNHVFVVKCKDGTYAKLQFTDFTNDENVKGHVTFTYQYPVN